MSTLGSLSSSFGIAAQLEPERGFWFGKPSTEWWEGPLQANTNKYGEKQLVDDTNNVGLECRMR